MSVLVKQIAEAETLVKYGIDELALIKLCQRLGVIASEPPLCSVCNQAIKMAKVSEGDGFAWRCPQTTRQQQLIIILIPMTAIFFDTQ